MTDIAMIPASIEIAATMTVDVRAVLKSPASQSPTNSWAIPAYKRIPAEIESRIPIVRRVLVAPRLKVCLTPIPCQQYDLAT